MATIVFDLGFTVLGILAGGGTVEDPFECVAEGHLESDGSRSLMLRRRGLMIRVRVC